MNVDTDSGGSTILLVVVLDEVIYHQIVFLRRRMAPAPQPSREGKRMRPFWLQEQPCKATRQEQRWIGKESHYEE